MNTTDTEIALETQIPTAKKPFILPKIEKVDVNLTEAAMGPFGGTDMGMYQS